MVSLAASLKKAGDEIRGMYGKLEEQLLIERARDDKLRADIVDLTGMVTRIEEILRITSSKERMV